MITNSRIHEIAQAMGTDEKTLRSLTKKSSSQIADELNA